jgi:hypothetical protein
VKALPNPARTPDSLCSSERTAAPLEERHPYLGAGKDRGWRTPNITEVYNDWELDVSLQFGIKDPHDIEVYGNGIKVIEVAKGPLGPIITATINA